MKRILLLDDSPTIQRVVSLSFTAPDYEVRAAGAPAAANDVMAQFHPDVIVAYVRFMGDANPEFFINLKAANPSILLLAESSEDLSAFEAAGFANILRKPFHTEELKKSIQSLLGNVVGNTRASAPSGGSNVTKIVPPPPPGGTGITKVPPPPPVSEGSSATRIVPPPPPGGTGITKVPPPPPTVREIAKPPPPPAARATAAAAPSRQAFVATREAPVLPSSRPPTTIDTEALERAYRKTLGDAAPAAAMHNDEDEDTHTEVVRKTNPVAPPPLQRHTPAPQPQAPLRTDTASASAESVRNEIRATMEQIRNDARGQVQNWMSRELTNLAKEVVREEIRKLIDGD